MEYVESQLDFLCTQIGSVNEQNWDYIANGWYIFAEERNVQIRTIVVHDWNSQFRLAFEVMQNDLGHGIHMRRLVDQWINDAFVWWVDQSLDDNRERQFTNRYGNRIIRTS